MLAAAAAAATFKPDMEQREKLLWLCLIVGFVVIEMRSIMNDRNQHETEQSEARRIQIESFKQIADGINKSIANSDVQLQQR